jgi:phage gp36-like protein
MALATLPVSYTNAEVVFASFPELGSASNMTDEHVVAMAGMVEARINAKLRGRYDLPFTSEFPVLRSIATDMTIYRLLMRTMTGKALSDSPWPERWKEAMEDLESLCAGSMSLVDSAGDALAVDTTRAKINSTTFSYAPTTSELDPGAWPIDGDKVDDEVARRDELS